MKPAAYRLLAILAAALLLVCACAPGAMAQEEGTAGGLCPTWQCKGEFIGMAVWLAYWLGIAAYMYGRG